MTEALDSPAGGHIPVITAQCWDPYDPAVLVESEGQPSRVFQVRHDSYPFQCEWTDDGDLSGLFRIADAYIEALSARLSFPRVLPHGLVPPLSGSVLGFKFVWLRDQNNPTHSHWVERHHKLNAPDQAGSGDLLDRVVVLLASLAIDFLPDWPLMGGQGIRILARVGPPNQDGLAQVVITGLTSTLPSQPLLDTFAERFASLTPQMLRDAGAQVAREIAFPPQAQVDHGWTISYHPSKLLRNTAGLLLSLKTAIPYRSQRESVGLDATSHAFAIFIDIDSSLSAVVSRQPLIAFATEPAVALAPIAATALVYSQDPVSKNGPDHFLRLRPRRLGSELDKERVLVSLGLLAQGAVQDTVKLANAEFVVHNARLVDPPLDERDAKEVPKASAADVTSDEFSAVNAFHHTRQFFWRLRHCGIKPVNYFRLVDLPLDVHYRAGIIPGFTDGRTVNAQVRFSIVQASAGPPRRSLELRFALGDLSRATGRLPANQRSAVEHAPLGVASDPRWCWHEFGHVLIAASVGELELRFAHSVGDALAAILCDPSSKLACDQDGTAANAGAWRGVTFPWILIPRRHDRDVQLGWSWCGHESRGDGAAAAGAHYGNHGYSTEQILSSSLFRLYRAIGGDSTEVDSSTRVVPATVERQKAADYCAYLIVRAVQLLGPAVVTPCENARVFVDTLCKADIFTDAVPGPGGYVGGTVYKVVQWAFERQGLYGVPIPASPIIGPEGLQAGQTEVDLAIEDRRLQPDGPYSPINLLGGDWHAQAGAIDVRGAGTARQIYVTVKNRGKDMALAARVGVWSAPLASGRVPDYPGAAWTLVESLPADAVRNVPGHDRQTPGQALFGPFTWEPSGSGDFAILAAASCDNDRSNIDPATAYPSLTVPSPIAFLVAFDNNLGLTKVTV